MQNGITYHNPIATKSMYMTKLTRHCICITTKFCNFNAALQRNHGWKSQEILYLWFSTCIIPDPNMGLIAGIWKVSYCGLFSLGVVTQCLVNFVNKNTTGIFTTYIVGREINTCRYISMRYNFILLSHSTFLLLTKPRLFPIRDWPLVTFEIGDHQNWEELLGTSDVLWCRKSMLGFYWFMDNSCCKAACALGYYRRQDLTNSSEQGFVKMSSPIGFSVFHIPYCYLYDHSLGMRSVTYIYIRFLEVHVCR